LLDIVIVNYQSTDYLIRCLNSLKDALKDISANIYIQDNGSNSNVKRVQDHFPKVNITYNRHNIGFSAAVNRAVIRGSEPFVLLLNPDTIVQDGFLKTVLKYGDEHPEVGIVGPKILNTDNSVQGSARTFPTLLTGLFGRTSILSRLFPNNRFTRGNIVTTNSDGKTPMEVDWVSGATMLIRRSAIDDVGLMDEKFFLYWEDADWCRRMWKKGWKVIYLPSVSVVHYVGKSSQNRRIKSTIDFHKSSYRIFVKYTKWPFKNLLKPVAATLIFLRLYTVLFIQLFHFLFNLLTGKSNKTKRKQILS
jgi:GT2 family glycosyltransferase